jgi:hypothetical protein
MHPEGMVHALEEVHRLLKPGGVAVDIHPIPELPLLEVYRGSSRLFSQAIPDEPVENTQQADDALARAVQRGWFVLERRARFEHLLYAGSVKELRDHHVESGEDGGEAPCAQVEALYARADRILRYAGPTAEVAVRVKATITRLKSIP